MRVLGLRRRRRLAHEKPGLGEIMLGEIKLKAELTMDAYDEIPPHIRELVRATGNIGDAAFLWCRGIRSFEEAEIYIAKSAFEKLKHKRIGREGNDIGPPRL